MLINGNNFFNHFFSTYPLKYLSQFEEGKVFLTAERDKTYWMSFYD